MTDLIPLLGRSALAGAATGARSLTALAALSLAAGPGAREQPDRLLSRKGVKVTASLGAVQELVLDKLPVTPSRLKAPGLLPRIAVGAVCGVVISRRAPGGAPATASPGSTATASAVCAVTGAAAAGAAAWLGSQWRAFAAPRLGHDWIGALVEDAAAVTLAAVAARTG
jgi:uncharacterized membrane protein